MYLDSAILIKLVVREPDSFFYLDQIDGHWDVCCSELSITECWSALFRKQRERAIQANIRKLAWQKLEHYFSDGMLGMIPVDQSILKRANRIISACYMKVALRSLDAVHLACCESANAFPLLTNDRQMRIAGEHLHFPLGPLP